MKLRRRQKRKRDQALDALASVTKTWSEWQLAKRAGKGAAKAKKMRQPSGAKSALGSKPVRAVGAAAVTGGAVAAIARKLKGGDPEPIYTPPRPSEPVAAPAPVSDPPPLAIAPDPTPDAAAATAAAAQEPAASEPAAGATALRDAADDAPPAADEPAAMDVGAPESPLEEPALGAAPALSEIGDVEGAAAVEPAAPPLGDEAGTPGMFPPGPSIVDEPAADDGEAKPEA